MNDADLGNALAAIHHGRRHVPDAPFVRLRLLAIDLEQVPTRRFAWPDIQGGFQGVFTATRLVVASVILVLFGSLLYGGLLTPPPDEQRPAVVSAASPSPVARPSPSAQPSPSPERPGTDTKPAQTRRIAAFEDGVDPMDLARSPSGALYYIDGGADSLVKVDPDGYQTVVEAASDPYGRSGSMTSGARVLATSPRGVYYVRDDGTVWDAQELPSGFNLITMNGEDQGTPAEGPRDPSPPFTAAPVAAATTGRDRDDLRLYAIDATTGGVTWTRLDHRWTLIPAKDLAGLEADGLGPARDLYSDGDVYVLYGAALQRYRDGHLDPDFSVDLPAATDLRMLSGTGGAKGHLYVLDASTDAVLEVAKADGRLLETWSVDEEPTDDVRGIVADPGSDGGPAVITWVTSTGLYESVLSSEPVADRPAPARSPSPPAAPGADRTISWAGPSVRLEAKSLRIEANGKVFRGVPSVEIDDWAGTDDRELHAVWHEDGTEMRISFYLHQDGSQWWVDEIWMYDGTRQAGWVYFQQLDAQTRTLLGEAFEGDLRLEGGRPDDDAGGNRLAQRLAKEARLRIDGLRLTAFEPGTGPAELTGCRPLPADVDTDAIAATLIGKAPAEVEAYLAEKGYCREYRYAYTLDPTMQRGGGQNERWCVAPPEGEVRWVGRMDRTVVVDVEDFRMKSGTREQPFAGWGCPLDDGSTTALPDPLLLPSAPRADLEPLPSMSPGGRRELGFILGFETATMLPGQHQRVEIEVVLARRLRAGRDPLARRRGRRDGESRPRDVDRAHREAAWFDLARGHHADGGFLDRPLRPAAPGGRTTAA